MIAPSLTHELTVQADDYNDVRLRLQLRRFGDPSGKPVLLLHGANTGGNAFLNPHGGLAGFLAEQELDVWILDWRGSPTSIARNIKAFSALKPELERSAFAIKHVARYDLGSAVELIRAENKQPLSIVGFCIGGAALSYAFAMDTLPKTAAIDRLVIMTLGLFFQVPWDTWLKSREYIIDQVIASEPKRQVIDPQQREPWPALLTGLFERWPAALFARRGPADASQSYRGEEDWFKRLAFMYGEPYSRLATQEDTFEVGEQFGPLHLGLYIEAIRMIRSGYSSEVFPARDDPEGCAKSRVEQRVEQGAMRIKLITGAQNRLWHRESIDLMYEWLRRLSVTQVKPWCTKTVFSDFAHLDLLWGAQARERVYPEIYAGVMP